MKNYVRDKRMAFGMTQDELSEKLDVSRQTIISLEKGKYNPSINLAFKLSRLFTCTIEDLFIYEEEEKDV
ncbi:MAG: helix-turn-helix transcriptional regulator [Psychrobacillus psychrotolerans]|uniref:Putative transcriptional regulator n=2 Tax=Psychrobacillus psychrotolerans TaxID=126156 RepID=A0A1I6B8S4_9BACI|nr:helix-turn-helix transcriptional regulator [Psychrobacillus psychrotolerans]SFQ77343.1 putative transcriptional regulator [Psychrobacillus psychrotolerans]